MASFFRSVPRALSRASACQPLTARARAAPFLYRGLATTQEQPRIRLGSVAPDFSAKTTSVSLIAANGQTSNTDKCRVISTRSMNGLATAGQSCSAILPTTPLYAPLSSVHLPS